MSPIGLAKGLAVTYRYMIVNELDHSAAGKKAVFSLRRARVYSLAYVPVFFVFISSTLLRGSSSYLG
jgi:hypothetical protein